MANSKEVTTVLALIASQLANDKSFEELHRSVKRLTLQMSCEGFFKTSGLPKHLKNEFSERYVNTVMVPWLYR